MTASNPAAIQKIDEMIASVKLNIQSAEDSAKQALATLEQRIATVKSALDQNLGLYDTGLVDMALKVEKLTAERTGLYTQLNGLLWTRKAAGGE